MSTRFRLERTTGRAEILIYDAIGAGLFGGGVSAEDVVRELGELGADTPLTVRINSPGGSVFDGFSIYNALRRHEGEVTVEIDGIAASAASVIAMAGDVVRIASNATLMIHEPSAFVDGTAVDLRSVADRLDKIREDILDIYEERTGRPREQLAQMVADETWIDAEQAIALGFADEISGEAEVTASANFARFFAHYRRVPKPVAARFAAQPLASSKPERAPKEIPKPMPDFSPNLAATLSLPQSATEGDVLVGVRTLQSDVSALVTACNVKTAQEALGHIEALKLKAQKADSLEADLERVTAQQSQAERDQLIKEARAAGKLTPAMEREFLPTLSNEALRAFVATAPKVAGASGIQEQPDPKPEGLSHNGKTFAELSNRERHNLFLMNRPLYEALKAAAQ
ncbi:MAG: ATP-dependent Clp protease proteolytic subunit [Polyangiaceae bacterium]